MIQATLPPTRPFETVGLPGAYICAERYDTQRNANGQPLQEIGGTKIMAIHTPRAPRR